MSIDCSSNSKLDALNAKKAELESQVANLASAGSSAMADIKAKVESMVSALKDMIPEPTVIPNFKKELQELSGLAGEDLVRARAAFKERWGDALPDVDIDGLMDKITIPSLNPNFNLCDEVPNIDAPEIVDGKVTKVIDKGPEPTTPIEGPPVVETVTPTIVAKEKQPSVSGLTTRSYSELLEAKQPYDDAIDALKDSYFPPLKEWSDRSKKLKKTKEWKKIDASARKRTQKYVQYYNVGANDEEKKLIDDFYSGYGEATKADAARKRIDLLDAYYTAGQYSEVLSSLSEKEFLTFSTEGEFKVVSYTSRNRLVITTEKFNPEEVDSQVKSIFQQYEKEILEYQNYKSAKSGD